MGYVNQVQTEEELAAVRRCVQRGTPFGGTEWVDQAAYRLGLECTLREAGRPDHRAGEGPEEETGLPLFQ